MTGSWQVESEFSRLAPCDTLDAEPTRHDIEATPAERAALSERFGLERLDRLEASLTLSNDGKGVVRLSGALRADVVQACVVTLEPVPSRIEEAISLVYSDNAATADGGEAVVSHDDETWPEPIVDGKIDIGETVSQQLAVALDPYPRVPGAVGAWSYGDPVEEIGDAAAGNPFRALNQRKNLKP